MIRVTTIFTILICALGAWPLVFILTLRFLKKNKNIDLYKINGVNTGVVCSIILVLTLWCVSLILTMGGGSFDYFEVNFENFCLSYNATLILGLIVLGLIVLVCLVYFFESMRMEEICVFVYLLNFGILLSTSRDFIGMFVLLEGLNVCTYILILSGSRNLLHLFGALKYVVITIGSTCFLLLGIALLYSTYGYFLIDYFEIILYSFNSEVSFSGIVGVTFVVCAMLIKLGIFPFHRWLIDIYGFLPLKAVFLLSTFIKMAVFCVFYNIYSALVLSMPLLMQIITIFGTVSIIIGGVGAIFEWKLTRFIAFIGLVSIGTLFLILPYVGTDYVNSTIISYLVVYNLSLIHLTTLYTRKSHARSFSLILSNHSILNVSDMQILLFVCTLFTLINLPPLSGFYPKLMILYILYSHHEYVLMIIVLFSGLLSVVFFIKLFVVQFNVKQKQHYTTNTIIKNENWIQYFILGLHILTSFLGLYLALMFIL